MFMAFVHMMHFVFFVHYFFPFFGIFAPDFLASERAIAMPCFGFVTTGPFFEPLWSSPRFISCMTFSILALPFDGFLWCFFSISLLLLGSLEGSVKVFYAHIAQSLGKALRQFVQSPGQSPDERLSIGSRLRILLKLLL